MHIKKKLIYFTLWAFIAVVFSIGAGLSGIYLYISPNLPAIESLKEVELQTPLRVYSLDNKLIGEFGEKRRDPVAIDQVPQQLIDAVLSAEDDAFFEHGGVDFKGLLRAASQLVLSGEIQSGGSTITMQVARNFFLSREQTFSRKFNEIFLALKIEKSLSKQEILELYLNKIYLGNRAYGVKAAAQVYYGKPLDELSVAQMAMIAGLPKAPSTYNPIANPSRALIRRNWILKRMLSLDKLSEQEYKTAFAEPVTARYYGLNLEFHAPYVAEAAREKAIELFGDDAYTNGYKIYTTVDSKLQASAQKAVVEGVLSYDLRHGYRGPEAQLDPAVLEPLTSNTENTSLENQTNTRYNPGAIISEVGAVNLIPWLETLKKTPTYGPLEAAAVIRIGKDFISVLTGTGKTIDIPWENGLKESKRYINENYAANPPNSPSKIVSLGDIIRIYPKKVETVKEGDNSGTTSEQWYFSQLPDIEAALVALNPDDGAIRSVVGGFDFAKSSFNRAMQAKRQPGSNFKPFVYTAALENGITPGTVINDAPIVVDDNRLEDMWRPENASGEFYGPTRVRKALYLSRNLISIRLLRSVGIDKTIASLGRFGIQTDGIAHNLSMALGSHVMTPLEVATGYSAFANGGYKIEPYIIHHIRDRHDKVLYTAKPLVAGNKTALQYSSDENSDTDNTETKQVVLSSQKAKRIMDSRIAYLMNSMLRDVINRGTATRAKQLGRDDLAGKTGTTNGPTDAWFSGYNTQLVATTWVGFDSNQEIGRREFGGTAALPIWMDFMEVALKDMPSSFMHRPNGIVTVNIDADTGERALPSNPNSIKEIFLQENAPRAIDPTQMVNGGSDNPAPEEIF